MAEKGKSLIDYDKFKTVKELKEITVKKYVLGKWPWFLGRSSNFFFGNTVQHVYHQFTIDYNLVLKILRQISKETY